MKVSGKAISKETVNTLPFERTSIKTNTMSRTFIVVTLQVEALHNWPAARQIVPEMGFLADLHRHIFHIKATLAVKHDDRDVEIIKFKRELLNYFQRNYYDKDLNVCNFGPRSCETLAKDLMEAYDLQSCEVLEDGENGAIVIK